MLSFISIASLKKLIQERKNYNTRTIFNFLYHNLQVHVKIYILKKRKKNSAFNNNKKAKKCEKKLKKALNLIHQPNSWNYNVTA